MQGVVPPGSVYEIIAKQNDGYNTCCDYNDAVYIFFCPEESQIEQKIQDQDNVHIPAVLIEHGRSTDGKNRTERKGYILYGSYDKEKRRSQKPRNDYRKCSLYKEILKIIDFGLIAFEHSVAGTEEEQRDKQIAEIFKAVKTVNYRILFDP